MRVSFVCARSASPFLQVVDGEGPARPAVPDGSLVGSPRFPAVSGRLVAYSAVTRERRAQKWLTALAVVERPSGVPLDVLPGAAVHTRAAWAPGGDRLAFVRPDPVSSAAALVLYDVAGGLERIVLEADGLRAVAWRGSSLFYSAGAEIRRADLDSRERETLFRHAVASWFLQYGTDDYYGTIDELAAGPGGDLAVVVSWSQQGKPARRETRLLRGNELGPPLVEEEAWSPRWSADGALAVATAGAVTVVGEGGHSVRVSGLQAFDWA